MAGKGYVELKVRVRIESKSNAKCKNFFKMIFKKIIKQSK